MQFNAVEVVWKIIVPVKLESYILYGRQKEEHILFPHMLW